ncbi:MAG: isoprenyl transferase [Deltaproteobacteria bacterium]|nr:isoprenyl transferase [Deltaproteobacteria bacterium]
MNQHPAPPSQLAPPPPEELPRHVAVIMDGNGRWAQARGLARVRGHEAGAESVRTLVRTSRRLGLEALTLYAFSEENWSRPKAEVSALWRLLGRFMKSEKAEMLEHGIRLNTIGATEKLPAGTRKDLEKTMAATAGGREMVLTVALSYGGRQELTRAARLLCQEVAAGRLSPDQVDEEALAARLYTQGLPEVDLLIRTSGELRISNFLLWQCAYAEFYFTPTFFPDFREQAYYQALHDYAQRQRRFGRTGEQLEKPLG